MAFAHGCGQPTTGPYPVQSSAKKQRDSSLTREIGDLPVGVPAQNLAADSSITENPARLAASDKRLSPQMKLRLAGCCPHQTNAAASWRLSAARNTFLSNSCVATDRTWSSGRISLQLLLSNCNRLAAPCFSLSVISPWRRSLQIALLTSTRLPHHTTGANSRRRDSAWWLAAS